MNMRRLLIIGCGDVALRAVKRFVPACRIYALTHTPTRAKDLRRLGITPLIGDLDHPASLTKLAGIAHCVMHFAPPQTSGDIDQRTHNLLAALDRGEIVPQRLVYISTTGVYGNCDGHWVEETRPPHPTTSRAKRRLSAETQLREWGVRRGVIVSILRVPGIYSSERLPLARLRNGTPTIIASEDSFTNHIHADDLARVATAAMYRGKPGRIYNATDDSNIKMGDWFDLLATRFNLPKPRRITRAQAQTEITPSLLSFLNESRRVSNKRLKRELRVRLAFPDVDAGTK